MKNYEKGQATVELCVGIIGIMVVIIAILYFGGIGITSIKTLINARTSAENSASDTSEGGSNPFAVGSWSYSTAWYSSSEKYSIPFLANDTPQGESGITNDYMDDSFYSIGSESEENHEFIALSSETDLNYSSRLESANTATIANLVFSSGSLPTEVSNGYDDFYTMHKDENAGTMKENIKNMGLFDFTTIKILDWRSNQVAFPAFSSE